MGSDLIIGLRLSLIGLSVTFLALGLLIVVMVLLLRVFPEAENGQEDSDTDPVEDTDVDEQRLEEMAVALAVGICLLEQGDALAYKDPSLGKLLEQ